eukprot:gene1307-11391_t
MKFFSFLKQWFSVETKKKVLILSGPTGSGKTQNSIDIAKLLNGEIINCDSLQLYKELNIGSNKFIDDTIPHHLFNIASIRDKETIGSGDFAIRARKLINEIHSRNGLPICVGGSGFFIQNLIYGAPLNPKSSLKNREIVVEELKSKGWEKGIEKLSIIDPNYANSIRKNDFHKLARSIEITEKTGHPLSPFEKFKSHEELDFDFRNIVIHMNRKELTKKIEERCEMIIENGLFEETISLMQLGFNEKLNIAGIGYKQAILLLKEENELTKTRFLKFLKEFKGASRKYSRTQFTWFRKQNSTAWIKNDENSLKNIQNIFKMNSKDYRQYCERDENLKLKNSTFNWMPKEKEEKLKFYNSLDELYLYKNEQILTERVKKINKMKGN